ncbi:MAG: hypothetical protein ACQKBY_07470 [Verrucomicrobiales bacterium]
MRESLQKMKWSLGVSLVLLVLGAFWLGRQGREVTELREKLVLLGDRAVVLGTSAEDLLASGRVSRPRDDREARVRRLVDDLFDLAKRQEEMGLAGGEVDPEATGRLLRDLAGLSAMDLQELVRQLRDRDEVGAEMRNGMLMMCLMMLAQDSPQSALVLLEEGAGDLGDETMLSQFLLPQVLGRMAMEDPVAAVAWLKANGEKFEGLDEKQLGRNILQSTAREDVLLALSLVEDLGVKREEGLQMIGNQVRDVAGAEALLRAGGDGGLRERIIADLAGSALAGDFEKTSAWLQEGGLSKAEVGLFAEGLNYYRTQGETQQWLEWMGGNLEQEDLAGNVEHLLGDWAEEDYGAAGEWLEGLEKGSLREAAAGTYATKLAPHFPEKAAKWVEEVPAGKARESLAKVIYQQWRQSDERAAAAFARQWALDQK